MVRMYLNAMVLVAGNRNWWFGMDNNNYVFNMLCSTVIHIPRKLEWNYFLIP
jgi:hypothetical protein